MAILLSYLFYFVAATASPLQRRQLAVHRKDDSGQVSFAFKVILITVLLSSFLALFAKPQIHQSLFNIAWLAIVCGIFGTIALSSQYTAQRHVEAGLTSLLNNLYTPVTIILATLFLHERLRPIQILGTIILLGSSALVSQKHRSGKWNFDKYFWMMVSSGTSFGVLLSAERALIKHNNLTAGTWISWGSQALCLGLLAMLTKSKNQHNLKDTTITGVLRFFQQLSWVVLVNTVGNLSLVSAITTFKVVIVFIVAALLLKEREDLKRKIIGSLFAVFGLLLAA